MWAGHLSNRVCLADHEQVADLSDVVLGLSLHRCAVKSLSGMLVRKSLQLRSPYDQEISLVRFVSEQRSTYEVVVQRRYCLPWVDVTELHERAFILRFDYDRLSQIVLAQWHERQRIFTLSGATNLRDMVVLLVLLAIVVDQYTTHPEVRDNRRVLFGEFP